MLIDQRTMPSLLNFIGQMSRRAALTAAIKRLCEFLFIFQTLIQFYHSVWLSCGHSECARFVVFSLYATYHLNFEYSKTEIPFKSTYEYLPGVRTVSSVHIQ